MKSEIRQFARRAAARPGFVCLAVALIGMGVGLETLALSVYRSVLARPLPYSAAERLVVPWGVAEEFGIDQYPFSWPNYLDYRDQPDSPFLHLAATRAVPLTLLAGEHPSSVQGARVTANLLVTLGARPLLGTDFDSESIAAGEAQVVLIGHSLWRDRLGARPDIVGEPLLLNGVEHTVIGVLPPTLRFPQSDTQLLVPLVPTGVEEQRPFHFLRLVGRLRSDLSLPEAQAQLRTLAEHLRQEYPDANEALDIRIVALHEQLVGASREALRLLFAACVVIFALACLNVAGLLVANGLARHREIGLRKALGCDRLGLLKPFLVEGMALVGAGGALGLALTAASLPYLRRLPPTLLPRSWELRLDPTTGAWAVLSMGIAALLFALAPAVLAERHPVTSLLAAARGAGARGGRGPRRSLVALQVTITLPLLLVGGVLVRHVSNLARVDLGFDASQRLFAGASLPPSQFGDAQDQNRFVRRAVSRLAEVAGVESVGVLSRLPLTPGNAALTVDRLDREIEQPPNANYRVIGPGLLATLAIPLLDGRDLRDSDDAKAPRVVLIDERLAELLFGEESPLGRNVRLGAVDADWRVVGVTGSARLLRPDAEPQPTVWVSVEQNPFLGAMATPQFVMRTRAAPGALATAARAALQQVDPQQAVLEVRPLAGVLDDWLLSARVVSLLLVTLAGAALALSATGLYAVLAFFVDHSRPEMAIRSSLGARPGVLLGLVVREGLQPLLAGALAGAGLAILLARTPAAGLQVPLFDPRTLLAVVLVLAVSALLATLVPARRLLAQDPVRSLREL